MRRSLLTAVAVGVAGVLVAGGWFAARAFTSPEQWEAQAAAPKAQPVLAEVTQGDLVDARTLGATVVPSSQTTVALVPVADAARSIVTASPLQPGASVRAGTVLLRVNGQPVIAFASSFPFYRDLGVGDSGPDVTALQQNLVTLGLLSRADGDFGATTANAVGELYRRSSATAPMRADPGSDTVPASTTQSEKAASEHPYLPLTAMAAVPALPAALAKAPAVGDDLSESGAVSFASGDAVLRMMIEPETKAALAAGSAATCTIGTDAAVLCTVRRVFDATATSAGVGEGDQMMTWAELSLDDGPIASARSGERAMVHFEVATLASDALLVPASALAQQSETSGTVLRQEDGGTFRTVQVGVTASLDGTVAVTGELQPGDLLRVDR